MSFVLLYPAVDTWCSLWGPYISHEVILLQRGGTPTDVPLRVALENKHSTAEAIAFRDMPGHRKSPHRSST